MDLYHYAQIVLLGIVEGVTEFLPISSTGHLLIAEHWLGTQEPDIFNVVIQAGAILAVLFIYWGRIVDLFNNIDKPGARDYLLKIGLAFCVTTALILVLTVKLKLKLPESLTPVAWATFIGGLIIFAIEWFAKNLYAHEDVSWFEACVVGVGQVVAAIFPGASRSGSTIMAGLAVGMKRPSVTQFTFLVGIPTMFAASAYATFKDRKDLHHLHGAGQQLLIDTALGFVVSGIVAFFVVNWLLRFVQSHTFNGFALYRVILGGGLLLGLYSGAIPDISNEPAAGATTPPAEITPLTPSTPGAVTPAAPVSPVTPTQAAPPAPLILTNATTGQAVTLPNFNTTSPADLAPASAMNTNAVPASSPATLEPMKPVPTTNTDSAPIAPGTAPAN